MMTARQNERLRRARREAYALNINR